MRTVPLPDGSIIKLVDIKAVQVHRHFWSSTEYYVQVELRGGNTRDVVQHLPRDVAHENKTEIVNLIQKAWDEVGPYECGYEDGLENGLKKGRSEGYSEGVVQGNTQGRRSGWEEGCIQGRRSILSYLVERRETLMLEQKNQTNLLPHRRRYLRDSITLLSEIIQVFIPEALE